MNKSSVLVGILIVSLIVSIVECGKVCDDAKVKKWKDRKAKRCSEQAAVKTCDDLKKYKDMISAEDEAEP